MPKVILICGRICCGKTTYSKKLCAERNAVLLSVDEIMLSLFDQCCGDMHMEYERRIKNYLFDKSLELIQKGVDVILDWGFWTKGERTSVKDFYRTRNIDCELYYLEISDEIWIQRLEKRNNAVLKKEESAYFMEYNMAEKFSSMFEKPTEDEVDAIIT